MTSTTKTWGRAISLASLVLAVACKPIDAPDQNAQALSDLTGSPSVSAVATAAQGLFRGMRDNSFTTQLYSRLGREGYNLDPGNPQNFPIFYTTLGDLAQWTGPYRTIKLADLVMQPLDKVTGLSAAQREAVRGFAKTVKAIQLLTVIQSTDVNGALTDATTNPTDPPNPISTKDQVFTEIFKLLDEAKVHLTAGGSSFPFLFTAGFAGFNTPATFLKVNRAYRARADIQQKNFAAALVDLGESFLDTSAPLTIGVFHTYSLVSGDVSNNLFEAVPRLYFVHPSIRAKAQKKADGSIDDRVTRKVKAIPPFGRFGLTNVSDTWTNYPAQDSRIPIIRNEELILLRAEANLGLGNAPAAIADLNIVRVNSGGLPPLTVPYTPTVERPTLLDELLYNKTYSMMWEEGSSSWLDARRYGRLAQLPHDLPGHVVFPYLRIADSECAARTVKPAGCTSPAGV